MPDFAKSRGQNVQKKPTNKFFCVKCHRLHFAKGLIQLRGNCKHHMEIMRIEQRNALLVNPDLFGKSLTLGTVPVPA